MRIIYALWFIFSYTRMKIRANIQVSLDILRKDYQLETALIKYPLEAGNDLEIFLLSGLLTMIPATLSVDLSEDQKYLYIHGLYVKDEAAFIDDVKRNLEMPIRRFCQ